jgi:phospholipase C
MFLKGFRLLVFLGLTSASLFAAVPASKHVVVVVEENHSYSSVINNASMPYLNSLAKNYSLLTNYYANTHPSIGNYFEMTTGQIITNNDGYMNTVTADNLVRELMLSGKTWKSYAESLPSVGYVGGDTGYYSRHHNPFSYFSDVVNSSTERSRLVPFTQFSKDLANNALPTFSFVVPNMIHDAHSGSLSTADSWLKTNIGPLLNNAGFKQDGILIIVFDESYSNDTAHGGGHVAAIVIGPKVKRGYRSIKFFQHQSTLKTIISAFGGNPDPGAAPSAPAFDVF